MNRNDLKIDFGAGFLRDLEDFERRVLAWSDAMQRQVKLALRRITNRWKSEAKKRVPVNKSTLKQQILSNVKVSAGYDFRGEVGTNIDYGVYLEFGTKHIAGGRVKALGTRTDITDADAIHSWPAKEGEATKGTSASIDVSGGAIGRRRDARGQFVKGGAQEQMPWLRPSWMFIRIWAMQELENAIRPPGAGAGAIAG